MPDRCEKRCPNTPPPAGWTLEALQGSPATRHLLEPGAQCEHDAGHDGRHSSGLLHWHDPPLFLVGGQVVPDYDPEPAPAPVFVDPDPEPAPRT